MQIIFIIMTINLTEHSGQHGVEEGASVQLQGHHQRPLGARHSHRAQGEQGAWSQHTSCAHSVRDSNGITELTLIQLYWVVQRSHHYPCVTNSPAGTRICLS